MIAKNKIHVYDLNKYAINKIKENSISYKVRFLLNKTYQTPKFLI